MHSTPIWTPTRIDGGVGVRPVCGGCVRCRAGRPDAYHSSAGDALLHSPISSSTKKKERRHTENSLRSRTRGEDIARACTCDEVLSQVHTFLSPHSWKKTPCGIKPESVCVVRLLPFRSPARPPCWRRFS